MNFGGFSWKRLLGISSLKSRISRRLGIPLTRGGRERKIGQFVLKGMGCLVAALFLFAAFVAAAVVLICRNSKA